MKGTYEGIGTAKHSRPMGPGSAGRESSPVKWLGAAMQSTSAPCCYVMAEARDSDFLLRGAKGGGLSGVSR